MPGSAVSTRRMRSAARGVPSATQTWPAWIDLPIPTPPPWWIETHDAPHAVLTSALSSGQSATASVPSAIDSVSRSGDATDPASRWSRPITTGTTTFEGKTGYGLSVDAERRAARLGRALGEQVAQTTTVTGLFAHAVPQGFTADPGMGIVRHADSGEPEALAAAARTGVRMPMLDPA